MATGDNFEQNNNLELELALHGKINAAYECGMSVVEITKVLMHWRVEFVHGVLRKAKLIPVMPRSEYQRHYDIDARLKNELGKKGYSFGRWCLGWKLDPIAATASLKDVSEEGGRSATHEALRRDFPEVYFEMFGGAPPPKKNWFTRNPLARFSVSITWESSWNAYIAKLVEDPRIMGVGHDWDDALLKMKRGYRLQGHIKRLESVIRNLKFDDMQRES
jgi:hypothetical protein